jgi:galactoside O-acetyltransferase
LIRDFFWFFKRKDSTLSSFAKFRNYFEKDDSTFLLPNSSIRFDVLEKIEQRKYVSIGKKGIINASFIFESEKGQVIIGDNVHLGGVTFISRSRIQIDNDVTMAWGVTIYDHNSHSIYWEHRKEDNDQSYSDFVNFNGNSIISKDWSNVVDSPIRIESKVWIGFDVTILKGVTIGEGAVVGAKSVVTKNVKPWTVVAGNPAVFVKSLKE